ncbi:GINS complex Psf3 component [Auriscalpium vulgare]|uniref:GINS complex Psf3 component n=1 Tax=Auriscalpium vulgare TaxID=40419 RepID=A0ACB8S9U1_9AGAM|nr:GINS complex Psf3 component [Auriscalpium vulgare]
MDDDYYSIDAILAENQKIQCTFKVDIPDMGHLDGGKDRDIKKNSKIQLPLWIAYILIYSDFADFTIPTPFNARVRNALNAEAKSVRLSGLVGAGGLWPRRLDDAPAKEMSDILTKTFRSRLVEVIDQAQHFAALGPSGGGGQSGDMALTFREGLDGTERELFSLAQDSAKKTKQWYESTERGRR